MTLAKIGDATDEQMAKETQPDKRTRKRQAKPALSNGTRKPKKRRPHNHLLPNLEPQ